MIQDCHGRRFEYLRLSITEACSLRCVYCRPDGARSCARPTLTAQEIENLAGYLARKHGLRKVRLTGGEPTLRRDLPEIIARLHALPELREVCLTTNGLTLAQRAQEYTAAGLKRINVSLDSMRADCFARITGSKALSAGTEAGATLQHVLTGLDEARRCGLSPIKINTVVLRGENDRELPNLLRWAAAQHFELRLIELMPMGPLAGRWAERFVSAEEMCETLAPFVESWELLPHGAESAARYRVRLVNGETAIVGLITAMSCAFCSRCNRLRIAADGSLFPCLMGSPSANVLSALRPVFDEQKLDALLAESFAQKPQEHAHAGTGVMTEIGG
ncbi:MAG TPA: GTP 3',8-cyclase MoaA [Planctomycetota bacterium]|jgi:cyclic pyranopterin phosphate synthase